MERFRVRAPRNIATNTGDREGMFLIPCEAKGYEVLVIVHDGGYGPEPTGWEHVSVSMRTRTTQGSKTTMPTWDVMCAIKDLFWDKEEAVLQIHPPASDYVNLHKGCLHLWRQVGRNPPLPDVKMV